MLGIGIGSALTFGGVAVYVSGAFVIGVLVAVIATGIGISSVTCPYCGASVNVPAAAKLRFCR
jgi:hypothetical protein